MIVTVEFFYRFFLDDSKDRDPRERVFGKIERSRVSVVPWKTLKEETERESGQKRRKGLSTPKKQKQYRVLSK